MPDLRYDPAYREQAAQVEMTAEERAAIGRAFESTPSLFQLLSTVRTRRMGLGYHSETGNPEVQEWSSGKTLRQPAGPLAYESAAPPVPLSETEEALLSWAGLGPNGVALADVGVHGGLSGLTSWAGRTVPGSSNDLSVDLFVINDRGVSIYRPVPERLSAVEIAGPDDYWKILKWYRAHRRGISSRRPDVGWFSGPEGTHSVNPMGAAQYNLNRPGSTWFLPVGDVGMEWMNLLLTSYEWSGFYLMDPDTGKPAGCEEWVRPGYLEVGFPIPAFDEMALLMHSCQAACVVENIRLACEALGLGAWVMGSYADDVVLGAYPEVARGLGFQFMPRGVEGNPAATQTCLGQLNVKEPVVVPSPQFLNASEAVSYVMKLRYGKGGPLATEDNWARRHHAPFRDDTLQSVLQHPRTYISEWTERACIQTVEYIVDKYGCCPAYVNPLRAKFSVQVHHVDAAYYDKFYARQNGSPYPLTAQIREHFPNWHPGQPDPATGQP